MHMVGASRADYFEVKLKKSHKINCHEIWNDSCLIRDDKILEKF